MFSYPAYIHSLAIPISAEAASLAISLSEFDRAQRDAGDRNALDGKYATNARRGADSLRATVDKFAQAIPSGARDKIIGSTDLMRHLWWIEYRLDQDSPGLCLSDPIDIARNDLPRALELFNQWYAAQAPVDSTLRDRVDPHMTAGQFEVALREVWPFFKTRMVDLFKLSDDLDGDKLANKLFGSAGTTVGLLEGV